MGSYCSLASALVSFSHLLFQFFIFETCSVVCGKEGLRVLFSSGSEHIHHLVGCFHESEVSCRCVVRCSLLEQHWSTSTFRLSFLDYLGILLLLVSHVSPLFSCLLLNDAIRRLSKHGLERSLDAALKLILSLNTIRVCLLASFFLLSLVEDF